MSNDKPFTDDDPTKHTQALKVYYGKQAEIKKEEGKKKTDEERF